MRLIDADALQYSDARDMLPTGQYITREEIDKAAEPVVRCKDCKHGEPNGQYGCKCYHYKRYETHKMRPNDFCSYAEKREAGKKEAEPTRHGHWIERTKAHPDLLNELTYNYQCSNCGYWDTHGANVEVPYCWHCGAKMDEEEQA